MTKNYEIDIYDLFSGPGYDATGHEGTPVILINEIKKFCRERSDVKSGCKITINFNDNEPDKIELLKENLAEIKCEFDCCTFEITTLDFKEIYKKIRQDFYKQNPKLIIMDQFGVSDVTPEIINEIAGCNRTDVLFFIPSSYIYRFPEELGKKIGINEYEENIEYNLIHKYICSHFKSMLPGGSSYYLAPFSIKKGSNIYGVIFGSSNLLGLQKFQNVCWELDPKNGDANFNITGEPLYEGEQSLFAEDNEFTKIKDFKHKIISFIREKDRDNHDIYIFCLESGFSVKKSNEILSELQRDEKIYVFKVNGEIARKKSFYLGYNNFKEPRQAIFRGE